MKKKDVLAALPATVLKGDDAWLRTCHYLVLFLLAYLPVLGINAFCRSVDIPFTVPQALITLPKFLCLLLLLLLPLKSIRRSLSDLPLCLIGCFLITVSISGLINTHSLIAFFSGLYFIYPFFLFLAFRHHTNKAWLLSCSKLLCYMEYINLAAILYQLLYHNFFSPVIHPFLTFRASGIFTTPIESGIFSVTVLYFLYYFPAFGRRKTRGIAITSCMAMLLTTSFTAISIGLIFLMMQGIKYIVQHRKSRIVAMVLITLLFILYTGFSLSGGSGHHYATVFTRASQSGNSRIEIFEGILQRHILWPAKFGYGSKIIYSLTTFSPAITGHAIFTDSFYNSLLVNFGMVGFMITLVLLFLWGISVVKSRRKAVIRLFFLFILGGISCGMSEVFPVNLLYPLVFAYFYAPENKETKSGILA